MKLDIIIPHYKEEKELVLDALNSINNQKDFDFSDTKVYIINDFDATQILFTEKFKFELIQITVPEKRSIGFNRQYALDHSDGDYILWCDSDDMFVDLYFFNFLDNITKNHSELEMVVTSYYEEAGIDNGNDEILYYYSKKEKGDTISTLHGKMYKRSFLDKIGAKFLDMKVSEDAYFNSYILPLCKNAIYVDRGSYLYRFHIGSITREKDTFKRIPLEQLKILHSSLKGADVFCENVVSRKSDYPTTIISEYVQPIFYIFMSFLTSCNNNKLTEKDQEIITKIKEDYKSFFLKYKDFYDEDLLERQKIAMNNFYNLDLNFSEYLKTLSE